MLEAYHKSIFVNIKDFHKNIVACVPANGGHFEHVSTLRNVITVITVTDQHF